MTPPPNPNPNAKGSRRRVHRRRFYGLSDELQLHVFERQRKALEDIFNAMEDYFSVELDAKILAVRDRIQEDAQIDAEFSEED